MLQVPTGTVKSRCARARARLAGQLCDLDPRRAGSTETGGSSERCRPPARPTRSAGSTVRRGARVTNDHLSLDELAELDEGLLAPGTHQRRPGAPARLRAVPRARRGDPLDPLDAGRPARGVDARRRPGPAGRMRSPPSEPPSGRPWPRSLRRAPTPPTRTERSGRRRYLPGSRPGGAVGRRHARLGRRLTAAVRPPHARRERRRRLSRARRRRDRLRPLPPRRVRRSRPRSRGGAATGGASGSVISSDATPQLRADLDRSGVHRRQPDHRRAEPDRAPPRGHQRGAAAPARRRTRARRRTQAVRQRGRRTGANPNTGGQRFGQADSKRHTEPVRTAAPHQRHPSCSPPSRSPPRCSRSPARGRSPGLRGRARRPAQRRTARGGLRALDQPADVRPTRRRRSSSSRAGNPSNVAVYVVGRACDGTSRSVQRGAAAVLGPRSSDPDAGTTPRPATAPSNAHAVRRGDHAQRVQHALPAGHQPESQRGAEQRGDPRNRATPRAGAEPVAGPARAGREPTTRPTRSDPATTSEKT